MVITILHTRKYAYGCCIMLWCNALRFVTISISFRINSLALGQSYDFPSTGEAVLKNINQQQISNLYLIVSSCHRIRHGVRNALLIVMGLEKHRYFLVIQSPDDLLRWIGFLWICHCLFVANVIWLINICWVSNKKAINPCLGHKLPRRWFKMGLVITSDINSTRDETQITTGWFNSLDHVIF